MRSGRPGGEENGGDGYETAESHQQSDDRQWHHHDHQRGARQGCIPAEVHLLVHAVGHREPFRWCQQFIERQFEVSPPAQQSDHPGDTLTEMLPGQSPAGDSLRGGRTALQEPGQVC